VRASFTSHKALRKRPPHPEGWECWDLSRPAFIYVPRARLPTTDATSNAAEEIRPVNVICYRVLYRTFRLSCNDGKE